MNMIDNDPGPGAKNAPALVPLCVDLDGTLIRTDLLWESVVRLLRRNPLYAAVLPFWWLRGRAWLKRQVAARAEVDVATLPYHEQFLEFLRCERRQGRPICLATASDKRLAQAVAARLGLFTEVLASDGCANLRGSVKAARLVERFGEGGFDYAGNSPDDLPVWARARQALVVNASPGLAALAAKRATVSRVFDSPIPGRSPAAMALRPHQWVKNLILFVPLITSHQITRPVLALKGLGAFAAFCLCASGVYVMNDLLDLEADRRHPGKCSRPFAAGTLPIPAGLAAFPLLLAAGLCLAWRLSPSFAAVLGIYLVLTTSYSWRLKQVALLDVFCLAALYTIRLIGGHQATAVEYSFWLLVFSMFIFLSLALLKRFVELEAARRQNRPALEGRGYAAGDAQLVAALGSTSGYLAVLVLALYVNSEKVVVLYRRPMLLLLICPLLLYWISRAWMIAHRGQMHGDPIVFALKDRSSYGVGLLTLGVLWAATKS
jgi:4-hydroxybenzoate polyprenyltransferase/phosphoserine phosphatase